MTGQPDRPRRRVAVALAALLLGGALATTALAEGQRRQQPTQQPPMSDAEAQLRILLLQRSMGFGGIFGPALKDWANTPSRDEGCGRYTDPAACNAHRVGDDWAADRLQRHESTPAERDWYNR